MGDFVQGQQGATSDRSALNAHAFLIWQILSRISTATLVQVQAVTNDGAVSPVGFVDVLPLVNQVDGSGQPTPHGTIHSIPYFRLQGGVDAVILDPAVGDIGIAIFADHDISSVVSTKSAANPGSNRRFDMADGLYIGGFLNGNPTQYVQFSASGITITSPNSVIVNSDNATVNATNTATVAAPTVDVNASTAVNITSPTTTINGNLTVTGTITA